MKNYMLFISAIMLSNIQAQDFAWVASLGGTNSDETASLVSDNTGNVYATGEFWGNSDHDPGVNQFILNSNGLADIFITKLDMNGNLVWAKQIGGGGSDISEKITLDEEGNVYVMGYFSSSNVDFDPSPSNQFIMSATGVAKRDLFLVKLDSDGNFITAMQIGGFDFVEGQSMTIDKDQNIVLGGRFLNTIDFDPGVGMFNMTAQGGYDAFIVKIDSSLNFLWARRFGGRVTSLNALECDETGNIYSCGWFIDDGDFNSDPASTLNLIAPGNSSDMFLHKIDGNGSFQWVVQAGGTSSRNDIYNDIAVTKSGFIYAIGQFGGTVDFDPSSSNTLNLTAAGSSAQTDAIVVKYDTLGNLIWAKQIEGPNRDEGRAIATDPLDDIYLTGFFQVSADFDPNPTTVSIENGSGFPEIFVAKWSSAGDYIWSQGIGDTGTDAGNTINYCENEQIYVGGVFTGTVDFNNDPSVNSNTSSTPASSLSEAFIYAIDQDIPCIPQIENSISLTGCDSLLHMNQFYPNSISLVDTFLTSSGCDSILTTNITINNSAASFVSLIACEQITIFNQTFTNDTMIFDNLPTSNFCDSIITYSIEINPVVFGSLTDTIAINESYILPSGAIVNQAGQFFDTISSSLACDSIITITLFLDENVSLRTIFSSSFSYYPNPVNEFLTIKSLDNQKDVSLTIKNNLGQTIASYPSINDHEKINMSNFLPGIYTLCFISLDGKTMTTSRVLKK